MRTVKYTLNVGAKKPFYAFHMTDNHVCLADGRDCAEKNTLANRREKGFSENKTETTEQTALELFNTVRQKNRLLIHTGDLIDFVSYKNLEFAKSCFENTDVLMCAGNHEFSLFVGEAWEDEDYKAQSLSAVKAAMPEGILFGTREINGVRFITLFNGYYYILPELYEKTAYALSDGAPCVLLAHTPLFSADTYKKVMNGKPDTEPPYLCGCPAELLGKLSEHRYRQQCPDKTTLDFIRLCNEAKNLKAVLTGHIHEPLFSHLDGGVAQIAASGAYDGVMNEYLFV